MNPKIIFSCVMVFATQSYVSLITFALNGCGAAVKPEWGTVDGVAVELSSSKRYLRIRVTKNIKMFVRARDSPGQARFPVIRSQNKAVNIQRQKKSCSKFCQAVQTCSKRYDIFVLDETSLRI